MVKVKRELSCDRCGRSLGEAPSDSPGEPDLVVEVSRRVHSSVSAPVAASPGERLVFDALCVSCSGRVADLLAMAAGKPLPARARRARGVKS